MHNKIQTKTKIKMKTVNVKMKIISIYKQY